ncbi:MAG: hypothetical protein AAFZ18_30985 [Myxococcota bacterium]
MTSPAGLRLRSFVLASVLVALTFVLASPARAAEDPEPGDEVRLVLHDGNVVKGMLLGTNELGYRISFAGTEVVVHYTSVASVEIVTKEALLEEMRPGGPRSDLPPESPPAEAPPPAGGAEPPAAPETDAPLPSMETTPPETSEADAEPLPRLDPEPQNLESEDLRDAPPKPRSRGGALMTTGFILLGVGGGLAITTALLDDEIIVDDSPDLLPALTVAGGIMASVGVGLAVTGTVLKIVSGSRIRRWERRYGGVQLVPTVGPGSGGVALVGRF